MRNQVLFFFLLVLRFRRNLILNIMYKYNEFFEALFKKDLKFISDNRDSLITFGLSHVLLSIEVDRILEE